MMQWKFSGARDWDCRFRGTDGVLQRSLYSTRRDGRDGRTKEKPYWAHHHPAPASVGGSAPEARGWSRRTWSHLSGGGTRLRWRTFSPSVRNPLPTLKILLLFFYSAWALAFGVWQHPIGCLETRNCLEVAAAGRKYIGLEGSWSEVSKVFTKCFWILLLPTGTYPSGCGKKKLVTSRVVDDSSQL